MCTEKNKEEALAYSKASTLKGVRPDDLVYISYYKHHRHGNEIQ
jgi:hypothetical protein